MVIAMIILSASFLLLFTLLFMDTHYYVQEFFQRLFNAVDRIPQDALMSVDLDMYVGTLLLKTNFDCEEDMMITDFSQYADKYIIGVTIYTTQLVPAGQTKEEAEQLQIIPNVLLYSTEEGKWQWEKL